MYSVSDAEKKDLLGALKLLVDVGYQGVERRTAGTDRRSWPRS
jgi:hypothetical protein